MHLRTSPRFLFAAGGRSRMRAGTSLHFLSRHIFFVRRDMPHVPERIFQSPGAVAVELVLDRPLFLAASGDSLLEDRVHVFHINHQTHWRAAECSWALVAHLGKLVG